ncbi:hypothetical protein [Bradyrhizobium sp. B117]|uniref:hypothetical protein n=1 Tax=Bradyrhizobium sp. B117 TaxID=3140246 RepID=UPI003183C81D
MMWLLGRLAPDHKTIADFRKDNGLALRNVCARFVELCREMGLLATAIRSGSASWMPIARPSWLSRKSLKVSEISWPSAPMRRSSSRATSSEASRDHPSTGLNADAKHLIVLPREHVSDQAGVGGAFIGLAKRRAVPELLQDQIEILVEAIVRDD